jgi:putative SOS response-associated peptidase YedK
MCGRFRLARSKETLAEHFGASFDDDWEPRYNLAPGQRVPVVRQPPAEPRRLASLLRWGLIPSWAKEAAIGYRLINARAETLAAKPAFRDALGRRRCLIPADGFYEWKKEGKSRRSFCFTLADGGIFAFAGLWESWRSAEGKDIESCSIVTTAPNALVAEVHDRMPAILPPESYDLWLDPGFQKTETICDLLRPFEARQMRRYEVSPRVNLVANDDPACAAPV